MVQKSLDSCVILAHHILSQWLSAPLQTTSYVDKSTKNLFNAVMFDECELELLPEVATRGRLFNLMSAFSHILSAALH